MYSLKMRRSSGIHGETKHPPEQPPQLVKKTNIMLLLPDYHTILQHLIKLAFINNYKIHYQKEDVEV